MVVSEAVVHQREVVEVEADHGDRSVVALRAVDRQAQQLLEHRPARQAGQLVVVREERDVLLVPLALGDVEDHAVGELRQRRARPAPATA